mmetsp:Transcript_39327/g.57859  ORF Transcript_39327/g.57859 Transcript_39327/m.57859 type:complete len:245 (+) Transcript_39327:131-865(+)|eukprot:CAMPEP_0195516962 /NCGR_PEP_ID=MMETSP0794_2-20130614/9389_1 /TAXON_ID=515487 /ORGANISM="Stephanopyxis turris, Strain CCMP 815" /LENGTH=244 /DNA_ID=CAMNT_0040645683 /DNA_START=131 /DNA_END=865 /DNA_ORIENTATION=+
MPRQSTFISLCCLLAPLTSTALIPKITSRAFVQQRTVVTQLFAEESESETENAEAEKALPTESGSDILNSPGFLKRKVEVLQGDIEAMDEKIAQAKAGIETGKAEWGEKFAALEKESINIQDRMIALSKDGDGRASAEVARVILEVIDNYDLAFGNITPETDEEKAIEAAYTETYDSIIRLFKDIGVTQVETVGKEFDYEVHNAVMTRPSDEYDEDIVSEELQKGFVLEDELIRAASVVVSSGI